MNSKVKKGLIYIYVNIWLFAMYIIVIYYKGLICNIWLMLNICHPSRDGNTDRIVLKYFLASCNYMSLFNKWSPTPRYKRRGPWSNVNVLKQFNFPVTTKQFRRFSECSCIFPNFLLKFPYFLFCDVHCSQLTKIIHQQQLVYGTEQEVRKC